MVKLIICLKRKPHLTPEAFRRWWLGSHSEMAAALPGLKRIVFNLTIGEGAYDGVAEQWYASLADMQAAYDSDIGQAVAADSMRHVQSRERLVVEEHDVTQKTA